MVDSKYPAISRIMTDRRNGSFYKDDCAQDKDYIATDKRIRKIMEILTELFMKQDPPKDDAEQFRKCLYEIEDDGFCDMMAISIDYAYVEGFMEAAKLIMEIQKG